MTHSGDTPQCGDLQRAIERLAREHQEHPTIEELRAYLTGERKLDREHLEEHVDACPECTAVVIELESLDTEDLAQDEGDLEAKWAEFKALSETSPEDRSAQVSQIRPKETVSWHRFGRAAVWFLVASLGMATAWFGKEYRHAVEPGSNRPSVTLDSANRATLGEPETVTLSRESPRADIVIVHSHHKLKGPVFARLIDDTGRERFVWPELNAMANQNFKVEVTWWRTEPGNYVLQLVNSRGELTGPNDQFALKIVHD